MGKDLAVGIEDFKTIIDTNSYYVDKTNMVHELLDPMDKGTPSLSGVSLFLRPRRFGKTLTLSMLRYFFDMGEKENAYLFDGLAISGEKETCFRFQNRFPVISLTFKDVKGNDEKGFLNRLNVCLKGEYLRHAYVKSVLESASDRETFDRISDGNGTKEDFGQYLSLLTQGLYAYHKVKPLVLLDEYDVPLNAAHQAGCFLYVKDIMASMFSMGLKTNDSLQAAIITGCLQMVKNQIFTGLNNLSIYSVTSYQYASSFGFTKDETEELLRYYRLEGRTEDVRKSYDGYRIGKHSIYNPFSLLSFIREAKANPETKCDNYWFSSSGDNLLREMLASSKGNEDLKGTFEKLVSGETADVLVDKTIVYDSMTESDAAIMGTLLYSGYLTMVEDKGDGYYALCIPNGEVLTCFRNVVTLYNKDAVSHPDPGLLKSFIDGDPIGAEQYIQTILDTVISIWDMTKQKEDLPHGFLLGTLTALNRDGAWAIKSEKEGGDGRSDIILSNAKRKEVVIIEVKKAQRSSEMDNLLKEGLKQIDKMRYDAEYKTYGYAVKKYCACFFGKNVLVKMT